MQHKDYAFFSTPTGLSVFRGVDLRRTRRMISRGPENHYPIALYKYRAIATGAEIDRLRAILIDSELYLSSRSQFNDPFDARAVALVTENGPARMRWARSLATRVGVTYKQRLEFMSKMSDQQFAKARALLALNTTLDGSGIFSFAGDPRDILMWSHYGASHTGICLRFEIARDPETLLRALPVQYSEQYPVIDWITADYADRTIDALLTKSPHWRYERERRIVLDGAAGKFLPFLPGALTHVIYGCKTPLPAIATVRDLLSERARAGKPSVKELYARQSPNQFSLGIFSSPTSPPTWPGRATWAPPLTT